MKASPLISIVLPVHNGASYLAESIESILAQTHTRWELIIVDDASTDDTPRIVSSFVARDSRVIAIRNAENRKLPGSLNVGFARARGDLLTWTSDDNYYRPEALAEMALLLEQKPGVDLVYAGYTMIDAQGRPREDVRPLHPKLLGFRNTVGACFLYRRRVYAQLGGYNEGLFLVEDYEYWVRVACRFQIARVETDLYCYRIHEGSLTAQRRQAIDAAREAMLSVNLPQMHWLNRSERGLIYLELARAAAYANRRGAMRKFLWRAISAAPPMIWHRHRRGTADGLLALVKADSSVAKSISSMALGQHELCALAVQAHFGGLVLRWYYRIFNTCAHPDAALKKLASSLGD